MTEKKGIRGNRKIALAAILLGALLSLLTFLFIQGVRKQLWEQSARTIMESTRQGCNTLKIQLLRNFEAMSGAAGQIQELSREESGALEALMKNYTLIDSGVSLYLEDGACFPAGTRRDEGAMKALLDKGGEGGIIDPHISSVNGVNVFNQYIKVSLKDGTEGWLIKELEVDGIVESFSLSFYNDTGFSYVINTQGDVLIRPPHPNSNKTIKNLFDMLPDAKNDPERLTQFAQSLTDLRTGLAVFSYQDEDMVFCYTPLKLQSDWYLISIIPENVVNSQTNKILLHSLGLIGSIILGIALLVLSYLRYANRANRRLSHQAEYIRHLYNAVPEGVALITAGEPHCYIQLNQEGLRLLGYPQGSANDAPKGKLFQDGVYPDDYEKMVALFQDTSLNQRKNVFEIRMFDGAGSIFWVSGIIEKTMDENGSPILIAAFHDITDEKLAKENAEREKLQERTTLVGAISNAYPVIISLNLTRDTVNFIYVKPGLMWELGHQNTYSELFDNVANAMHPDHLAVFKQRFDPENLRRTLGQDTNEVFHEARQLLADGRYHWISTQIIKVDNPYSDEELAILISRRIDDQRNEEERQRQALQSALYGAQAANEAKSQFLSNMSHDIRTPMNAVVGMTDIAIGHLDDPEKVLECLGIISRSSKHLLSLINDILDMSKIESGKLALRSEPFDLAELVSETVEIILPDANAKELTVDVIMDGLVNVNVIGDALCIRQVYINILSNAVKYTPDGGRICVEIRQEAGFRPGNQNFVFSCGDTGIGMSEEFLERLFLPFERAQDSTSSKIVGTGLGMAITKNLVDRMNGDIQVESRLGEGSLFTVVLPLQQQDVQPVDTPRKNGGWRSAGAEAQHDYTGKRILLVEDNEINREIARELLADWGVTIDESCDGAQALQKVAESAEGLYDLILMDIQMPVMDGYEATKAIRSLNRRDVKDIPILAMTANAFEEDVRAALAAGMDAHFSKPIDQETLGRMLYRYLAGE